MNKWLKLGTFAAALAVVAVLALGASAFAQGPTPQTPPPTALVAPATPAPTTVHTSGTSSGTAIGPTPLPAGLILAANQIKGRMTLREVSDQYAVPLDQLLAGLNLVPNTDPHAALKDLIGAGKIAEVTAAQQMVGELQK